MKQKFGRDLKSGKFMCGFDVEFQVEVISVIKVNSLVVTLMQYLSHYDQSFGLF